jgi:pyridinium-3,5-bisthiocarboxylic acid mononucleotide nickel chelatase
MKIAYLECQTGIAGDMCLGALVDAGVPLEYLRTHLDRLGIESEYQLRSEKVHHNGQIATKVHVDLTAIQASKVSTHHPHEGKHSHTHHPTAVGSAIEDLDHQHSHEHSHEHIHDNHEHTLHTHDPLHALLPSGAEGVGEVRNGGHHHHYDTPQRNLPQIEQLINEANLPDRVAQWSLDVFRKLAIAEGAVHGIEPSEVHFHEVGAVDAIVDIVGTCLGLDYLKIDQIYCSPLPTGGGTVRAAHGILPVPVPAVLKLLSARQVPVYSNGIDRELVTPTGAAIAVTLASEFGAAPQMQLEQIGLGAGTIELPIPNILRMWLGTTSNNIAHSQVRSECLETIEVLTTQIDDTNPQAIGYIFDNLFQAGAVDVFTQPIGMKKSRPGILLTVICPLDRSIDCEQIIFTETSTIGIRRERQTRSILPREIKTIATKYGDVRVKIARNNLVGIDRVINVQPEYEDCAALARQHKVPWEEAHHSALIAYYFNEVHAGTRLDISID